MFLITNIKIRGKKSIGKNVSNAITTQYTILTNIWREKKKLVKQYYLLINILSKMLRGSHQSQLNKNHNQSALVQRICTYKVLEFKQ